MPLDGVAQAAAEHEIGLRVRASESKRREGIKRGVPGLPGVLGSHRDLSGAIGAFAALGLHKARANDSFAAGLHPSAHAALRSCRYRCGFPASYQNTTRGGSSKQATTTGRASAYRRSAFRNVAPLS